MSTAKIATLMERLRIQSILQRMIKAQGHEQALDTVLEAIRLEFRQPISKANETTQKANIENTTHTVRL
jgi:hypothetical protein